MYIAEVNNTRLHWSEDGEPDGRPVVFSNALGVDLRLWDMVVQRLPSGLRIIRYDTRGHGLSDCPAGPYTIPGLARDAEALMEHVGLRDAVFVGLSLGGATGLELAAKRPDLVSALVISNIADTTEDPDMWRNRMAAVREGGVAGIAEGILDRWFGPNYRNRPEARIWRTMLARCPKEGYLGACAAIADADQQAAARNITQPVLAISGALDRACPPLRTQATAARITNARYHMMPEVAHLPCVEAPEAYADLLIEFIASIAA